MTIHQALEVLNPDNERQRLPIQRQAFAVLKSALKSISDSTDAGGELTITKQRKDKREDQV